MRPFPFERILVVNAKPELDRGLLRYAGAMAAHATEAQVIVAVPASDRVLSQHVASAARAALRISDSAALSFRVLLQPDLQLVFDIAQECAADVIVIHHPRELDRSRPLLRGLLFNAPCAVWLVPQGARPTLRRIVARVEPTRRGHQVLSIAAAVARSAQAEELIAVHSHFRYSLDWGDESLETMRAHRALEMYRFLARADVSGVNCTPVLEETPRQAERLVSLIETNGADLAVIDPAVDEAPEWQWNRRTAEELTMAARVPALSVRPARSGVLAELRERLFCEMEPLFN